MKDSICPKCLGAAEIMEPKPKPAAGFQYNICTLCEGVGTVPQELEDDFLLSLNEDNLNTFEE